MTPELIGQFTGLVSAILFFALIGLVVWVWAKGRDAQRARKAEFNSCLLEKFASVEDYTTFITSEEGHKALQHLSADVVNTRKRIASLFAWGIVVGFCGVGFLALRLVEKDLVIPGTILLAIGIGLLVAALVLRRFAAAWSHS